MVCECAMFYGYVSHATSDILTIEFKIFIYFDFTQVSLSLPLPVTLSPVLYRFAAFHDLLHLSAIFNHWKHYNKQILAMCIELYWVVVRRLLKLRWSFSLPRSTNGIWYVPNWIDLKYIYMLIYYICISVSRCIRNLSIFENLFIMKCCRICKCMWLYLARKWKKRKTRGSLTRIF